jgi:hypothetical protein
MKRLEYLSKLLWLIGLVVLLFIRFHFEQIILENTKESFNMLPSFWFGALIPFVMGLYIGLIFMKGKSIQLNKSLLLCVVLPCLIIILYSPITFTIASMASHQSNSFTAPIPFWMLQLTDHGVLAIVTGITLMAALFSHDKKTKS